MKRIIGVILAATMLFLSAGCSSMRGVNGTKPMKTYVFVHEDSVGLSTVTLNCDHTFVFVLHPLSSYIGHGKYESEDNALVLFTDDGQNHYTFRKESGMLIYDAERSSEIPSYCDISDGAFFE